MKKFIITTCMVLAGIVGTFAQEGKQAIGIHLNYGTEFKNVGIGFKYQYNITDPIRLEPSFDYFFKHDAMSMFDINLNAHYLFQVSHDVRIYPLLGLTYTKWHEDWEDNVSWNKSKFGINFGAGVEYALDDDWSLNFEVKYQIIRKFGQAVFNLGVAYKF